MTAVANSLASGQAEVRKERSELKRFIIGTLIAGIGVAATIIGLLLH